MKHPSILNVLFTLLLTVNIALAASPPAQLSKTGQTKCYITSGTEITCGGTGQDGDKQAGVAWPDPRFVDNSDGTVTDNLTGLVWLKNANCFGVKSWQNALNSANSLASGACGLSDGSKAGEWRLPNKIELFSLVDLSKTGPALPDGNPFSNVKFSYYWSSSSSLGSAWYVYMDFGFMDYNNMVYDNLVNSGYVWPVRAGQ